MLQDYLLKYHAKDLEDILNATEDYLFYSVYINFVSLFGVDAENANKILRNPKHYLPLCDEAAVKAQEQLCKTEQIVKTKVHVRITAVPLSVDIGKIGELVSTSGIVVRMSQPTVMKLKKRFVCKKCKHVNIVQLEWEKQLFRNIKYCEACRSESVTASTSLEQDDCSDYQEIKIQDKCKTDTRSYYSVGLQVVVLDDLVDKCKPGDNVDISGVIIRKWGTLKAGHRAEATTFLMANSISVHKKITGATFSTAEINDTFTAYWEHYRDNALSGRDNILASICPQLYGMYIAKLALAVVLCGGVAKTNETGMRVRGEPHLLLVGDPGTGKSQLLRVASRLTTRSVFTTGVGSTAAGLTAAAVKDSDGWHLEAGALVLADGGVCCVDEFTTMSSHDRTSVHEAMEQQTISIAKAGMVSTLNSRCSVVAAINPDGGCFTNEEWKTCLGNPLLSRFDLILLLRDTGNPEWDRLTSSHILKAACEDEENNSHSAKLENMGPLNLTGLWSEETLREYFAHVRSTLKPTLTEEAKKILSATYLHHRSDPCRKPERTTVRLLDSLIRLAEGHAKLMYRAKVEIIDAVTAAELVGTTLLDNSDAGCPFPTDPVATYRLKAKDLLKRLNLQELEPHI
ncbi:PREDICTED: DNA helicase MCM9-like [Vollenhovia emeryi]|uniref:DNA helicase MCM9-like n=1 Tax=Vollenhovia emeryi TaxID=411798 RepID=UPI0005F40557|nr:PREDICTED: DNA helicase MCM9-like [Vollenhovia emeryi]